MYLQTSTTLILATLAHFTQAVDDRDHWDLSNRYIVTLKDNVDLVDHMEYLQGLHSQAMLKRNDGQSFEGVIHNYSIANFQAYAGHFDSHVVSKLADHESIDTIEPDTLWEVEDVKSDSHLQMQPKAPKGLRMISHKPNKEAHGLPSDERYIFDRSAGDGTHAYIIDTGIYCANNEFNGRAKKGFNAIDPKANPDTWTDALGHGTHIAGIIGSKTFGVAKRSSLIAVKVMHGPKGPLSHVLSGYEWAARDIAYKHLQPKAVINLSVGGAPSPALNKAIDTASGKGITTVVMAGNHGRHTPPHPHGNSALRVSATDYQYRKAPFANWGGGTDIFAPGVGIMSTLAGKPDAKGRRSGTAQASAFVSGRVLYFKKLHRLPDNKATKTYVLRKAVPEVVTLPGGRKMPFAYNGSGK